MKQKKESQADYNSWDYYQRLVKHSKQINESPVFKERIDALMNKVEEYLDGPNEEFDQEVYLKDKNELQKLIESLSYPERIRKAS